MITPCNWCTCNDCGECSRRFAPAPEAKPPRFAGGQQWRDASGCVGTVTGNRNGDHWEVEATNPATGQSAVGYLPPAAIDALTFLGYAKPAADIAACPPPAPAVPVHEPPPWIKPPPPSVTRPIRREVSANGRDWCDIARLTDADAFESYPWRRTSEECRPWRPNEYVVVCGDFVEISPAPKPAPGRAETESDQAGAAAAALVSR